MCGVALFEKKFLNVITISQPQRATRDSKPLKFKAGLVLLCSYSLKFTLFGRLLHIVYNTFGGTCNLFIIEDTWHLVKGLKKHGLEVYMYR